MGKYSNTIEELKKQIKSYKRYNLFLKILIPVSVVGFPVAAGITGYLIGKKDLAINQVFYTGAGAFFGFIGGAVLGLEALPSIVEKNNLNIESCINKISELEEKVN